MTYEEAIAEAKSVGVGRCKGSAHLAITIQTLATVHAIAPALVYEGARKLGLSAAKVRKLDAASLGDLMFA